MMIEARKTSNEPLLVPTGIALRTEKGFALVVVHTMDGKAVFMEKPGDFRSD
jgi:hypothetical protein